MLKDRQKSILEAVIQEYIRTARPVASREIVREFKLHLSPATIRNEMLELDEEGYLEQPHTSAGRVPTDKGYRFFVDNSEEFELQEREKKLLRELFTIDPVDEFMKEFARTTARISNSFTAVGILGEGISYETGLAAVLDEPEFSEPGMTKTFGRLVDSLAEEMDEFFSELEAGEERIFIGSENPIKEARLNSMIVSSWQDPRGFEAFVTFIGPRRTNYQKHKAILKGVKEITKSSNDRRKK